MLSKLLLTSVAILGLLSSGLTASASDSFNFGTSYLEMKLLQLENQLVQLETIEAELDSQRSHIENSLQEKKEAQFKLSASAFLAILGIPDLFINGKKTVGPFGQKQSGRRWLGLTLIGAGAALGKLAYDNVEEKELELELSRESYQKLLQNLNEAKAQLLADIASYEAMISSANTH